MDTPSGRRRVRNGATLHSGDQIAATVMVDREAYVYLLSLDPDGQASVLFPDGTGAGRVAAGARVRVPPEGSVIRLDERTGTETLLVVASERPLATSAPELATVIRRAQTDAPPAAPAPVRRAHPRRRSRHRVQASRAGSDVFAPFPHRGVVTESVDGEGAYARAQADDGGVASFRYVFPHLP